MLEKMNTNITRIFILLPIMLVMGCNRIPSDNFPEERIISLMPAYTETIFALGTEISQVVAITDKCNWPPDKTKKILKIGNVFGINSETLVSLKPTIIFAGSHQKKIISRIGNYNKKTHNKIKLVVFEDSRHIKDIYKIIKTIAFHLNKKKQGKNSIDKIKNRIKKVEKLSKSKPKVYVYIDADFNMPYTAGGDRFISDVVSKAGGVNIFSHLNGYPRINREYIYTGKIDFILAMHGKKINWKIPEKTKIIGDIAPDIISRDGPRIYLAVEQLFERFHKE